MTEPLLPPVANAPLDALVVGRGRSLFAADLASQAAPLAETIGGARVLVVGGGGSIGSMTARLLVDYRPAALHVVDQSENYLAELVRDLRSRPEGLPEFDFRTLPLDYGSGAMHRLLAEQRPYDLVLNFAALKHVRSEKDVYSLLQMLDTNIVRHIRFKQWLAEHGHGRRFFAVSTDKAANPSSLMGVSKRLMEDVVFDIAAGQAEATTSARFANVAFSNGSLLQSFLQRLAQRQPLAVPRDTRRYFVSQREAGELCVLAAAIAPDRHIVFPRLDPASQLQTLDGVAVRVLEHFGLTPEIYDDEDQARHAVEAAAGRRRWPLLLTPLDTSGEKPYEEFVGEGETAAEIGLAEILALRHTPTEAEEQGLFSVLERIVEDPARPVEKAELTALIGRAVPSFHHRETGRNLDQRL